MKTLKNKLIVILGVILAIVAMLNPIVATAKGPSGNSGSGSSGASRANPPTQGQSQNSQSQQSQQLQSKDLDTQQTNQNSQSQKWTTGSSGQYRVFRMDSTNSGISTTPGQVLPPGGTTGTNPTGLTKVSGVGGVNTTPAPGLFPGGPTKVSGVGGVNTTPAPGLFPGGPTKVSGVGGINTTPAPGLFPGGPTKVSGIGGINTTPGPGLFGGGTGTGGTGTGGTGTGGTGTGGTGTGGTGTGGTGTGRPHPRGGYPGSNGDAYTAYRVDPDADPALPANAAPPVLVRIMNPTATNGPISFMINGQVVQLQAGEAGEFRVDGSGLVKFDRGGNFGESSYTLKQGDYRFAPTAKGWELYEESAAATQTGGLPRNALPGEGSK